LNFFLSINKKIFLLFLISIFLFTILFFFTIYLSSNSMVSKERIINYKGEADITKPKFSINSKKQKISVTANEGDFVSDNEIILKKNVVFKSNKFKIYSDNVTFNKKKSVAFSNDKSKFISDNMMIEARGFDIIDSGNIIYFKGKTKLIIR